MEAKDPLDQLLDGAMQGHSITPSATSKNEHLDAMRNAIMIANKKHYYKRLGLTLFSIAAAITALLLFLTNEGEFLKKETSSSSVNKEITIEKKSSDLPKTEPLKSTNLNLSIEDRSNSSKTKNLNNLMTNHPLLHHDTPVNKGNLSDDEINLDDEMLDFAQGKLRPNDILSLTGTDSHNKIQASITFPPLNLEKRKTHLNLLTGARKEDTVNKVAPKGFFYNKPFKGLSIAVEYSPEYIFNGNQEADQLIHSGGLTFEYKRKGYSIRTGLGLSVTGDITRESIDYKSYLGTTKILDSVQFEWDADHRKLTPVFYYTDQRIFEDQISTAVLKTKMRYTYLQIPIVLGYDFISKKEYSLGFRTGALCQILLKSEQTSTDYSVENDLIINMSQVTPDRLKLHWEALGGINLGIRLSDRFKLELEPQVRYYFNSVYEKSDGIDKPWSLSLRTAITYKLSH